MWRTLVFLLAALMAFAVGTILHERARCLSEPNPPGIMTIWSIKHACEWVNDPCRTDAWRTFNNPRAPKTCEEK